jgi:hypothetical protein
MSTETDLRVTACVLFVRTTRSSRQPVYLIVGRAVPAHPREVRLVATGPWRQPPSY